MVVRKDLQGMNVMLFITDQQRAIQHFPAGWAEGICRASSASSGTDSPSSGRSATPACVPPAAPPC